jgi:hypothetical protein
VVHREIDLPFTVVDYRQLGEGEQLASLEAWRQADLQKGFEFEEAPLMRITLFRLSEDRYRMLASWHHILFDGWSTAVVMEELLKIYEELVAGRKPVRVDADRYEDYIRYLESRDEAADEAYWRGYLSGVVSGSLLPFIEATVERNKGIGSYRSELLRLDRESAGRVEAYAQQNRITVNTVMQGVWSYLLSRYTGNREVIFGVTVSGRPEGLAGVEKRVGMYINALPLRTELRDEQAVSEWLGELQQEQVASREHQYTGLNAIGQWLGMQGRDLFDSLMIFENYPVDKVLSAGWEKRKLKVGDIRVQEQSNYPLSMTIHHGEELTVEFKYNSGLLEAAAIILK